VVNPFVATEKDLKMFHSQEYLDQLKKYSDIPSETSINEEDSDEFGIGN
jgi:acetoin utilization deacetylase AcuC-like enzyme